MEQNLLFFLIVNMISLMLRVMIIGLSYLFIIGVKIPVRVNSFELYGTNVIPDAVGHIPNSCNDAILWCMQTFTVCYYTKIPWHLSSSLLTVQWLLCYCRFIYTIYWPSNQCLNLLPQLHTHLPFTSHLHLIVLPLIANIIMTLPRGYHATKWFL